MPEKERIEEIRFFLKKNKTEFAKILGYKTPQSYTSYLSGKSSVSMNMIKALKEYDNRFNLNWILTGQGQMLLDLESNNNRVQNIDTNQGVITQMDGNSNVNYKTNDTSNKDCSKLEIENNHLKIEIELLKKSLTDKERLISLLEKNQK